MIKQKKIISKLTIGVVLIVIVIFSSYLILDNNQTRKFEDVMTEDEKIHTDDEIRSKQKLYNETMNLVKKQSNSDLGETEDNKQESLEIIEEVNNKLNDLGYKLEIKSDDFTDYSENKEAIELLLASNEVTLAHDFAFAWYVNQPYEDDAKNEFSKVYKEFEIFISDQTDYILSGGSK